ncbi:MAG: helix-hairpin-helix domain-containing protein [Bacilli bacterium]
MNYLEIIDKIKDFVASYKKYFIISSFLIIFGLISTIIFVSSNNKTYALNENQEDIEKKEEVIKDAYKEEKEVIEEKSKEKQNIIKEIYVDVKGEVKTEGVVKTVEGARVIDAIIKAGGFTKNYDSTFLNLSAKLTDGMIINVFSKTKVKDLLSEGKKIILDKSILNDPNKSVSKNTENTENGKSEIIDNEKISINTATIDKIMSLPGIGESKANIIIEYRTINGNFKAIEDLKNISGIGDSIYDKIKDLITI